MPTDFPIALLINGFTLALATAFLLIVLWYDIHRTVNQFFAIFLIFVQIWNIGFFLAEISLIVEAPIELFNVGYAISQAGFVGASVALYALMLMIAGVQPRRFRLLTGIYLIIGVGYPLITGLTSDELANTLQSRAFSGIFFVGFDLLTLYVTWRYRRKFNSISLIIGNILFVIGQGVSFLNPELGIVTLAATFSSLGSMAISFAFIRRELIRPLLERGEQLESLHDVSVSITSQFTVDSVLDGIAERAAQWLQADAAGIFLKRGEHLVLVAIYNLPDDALDIEIELGEGIAGRVADTKKSIYLENYDRDWIYDDEFDFARETFGSIISVPLIYANEVIGVLTVIGDTYTTLFAENDVRLLELLSSQAAVAISQANLFSDQRILTNQLEEANDRLRTVLLSTENPVIAVDRQLNLIFTNPAAETLFQLDTHHSREHLHSAVPQTALPPNYKKALKAIKAKGYFRYEIEVKGDTYICQVARLGKQTQEDGFVAVMNDISELKELDRVKSEMVRMTSHDLKNPLQAAFANLELLRDDVDALHDPEITLSVDNIDRQLNKMHRIISGILDLERARLGSSLEDICNPEILINEAIEELTDIADEKGIVLRADITPEIASFKGDNQQFKRAIVNIIENAIKFNTAGGDVLIQAQNSSNQIFITISDDGIGIPAELHTKIFERFYRGHQAGAEHASGSGLGLSLVKAVIESHNGQIRVRSQPKVGTTFHISLPAILS
ncbi:MAG: GAF domain-containing sensor histidine kinase [Phototrophicaceae bacterium]